MSFILICKTEQYKPVFESKAQEKIAKTTSPKKLFRYLSSYLFGGICSLNTCNVYFDIILNFCMDDFSNEFLANAIMNETKTKKGREISISALSTEARITEKDAKITPNFQADPNKIFDFFDYFDTNFLITSINSSIHGTFLSKISQNENGAEIEMKHFVDKKFATPSDLMSKMNSSGAGTMKIKNFKTFAILKQSRLEQIIESILKANDPNVSFERVWKSENQVVKYFSFDEEGTELIVEKNLYAKIVPGQFLIVIDNMLFAYNCSLDEINTAISDSQKNEPNSIKYVRIIDSITFNETSIENFKKNNKQLKLLVIPETQQEFIEQIKKSFKTKKICVIKEIDEPQKSFQQQSK